MIPFFSSLSEVSFHQKELAVKSKFGANVFKKIGKIKLSRSPTRHAIYEAVIDAMFKTTNKTEICALQYLLGQHQMGSSDLLKVLQGAHVLVADDGAFYRLFKDAAGSRVRISSHPSDAEGGKAYSFQGPVVKEMLFSTLSKKRALERLEASHQEKITRMLETVETEKRTSFQELSWFQLERSPIVSIGSFFAHSYDYMCYKVSREQQGPYGSSPHVDRQPILIRPVK